MDRRFYIVEVYEDYASKGAITESELKQRLYLVEGELSREKPDYDEAIDILLNGTEKEQSIKCAICGCDPRFAAGLRHYTDCPALEAVPPAK